MWEEQIFVVYTISSTINEPRTQILAAFTDVDELDRFLKAQEVDFHRKVAAPGHWGAWKAGLDPNGSMLGNAYKGTLEYKVAIVPWNPPVATWETSTAGTLAPKLRQPSTGLPVDLKNDIVGDIERMNEVAKAARQAIETPNPSCHYCNGEGVTMETGATRTHTIACAWCHDG